MENTEFELCILLLSLNFLTVNELIAKIHLTVGATKLNQHKGIMTSNLGLRICCFRKEVLFLFPQRGEPVDSFQANMV